MENSINYQKMSLPENMSDTNSNLQISQKGEVVRLEIDADPLELVNMLVITMCNNFQFHMLVQVAVDIVTENIKEDQKQAKIDGKKPGDVFIFKNMCVKKDTDVAD